MLRVLVFNIILFCSCAHSQTERYIGDDHYDPIRGVFFNPESKDDKGLFDLLKWVTTREKEQWPDWVDNKSKPKLPETLTNNQVAFTFINHSSFLIQFNGINILTDPIYSERVSPVSFLGPKRVRSPGLEFNQLPQIHYVLISHNHYDHMDLETLKRLYEKFNPLILVPLKDALLLRENGIKNVQELDWWASFYQGENFKVTFTPAQHFSGRGLNDRFKSLWGGYILKFNKHIIYFAGDTGYASHFKEIKNRFGSVDVALLPIGAYKPRWFMRPMHTSPEEAVMAHQDLGSKLSIGMHFGTFQLSDEGIYQPVEDLQRAKLKANLSPSEFSIMGVGETLLHNFEQ